MRQRKYIKPKIRAKEMRVALLETVSGGNQSWESKANYVSDPSNFEIEQGSLEIDKMFE